MHLWYILSWKWKLALHLKEAPELKKNISDLCHLTHCPEALEKESKVTLMTLASLGEAPPIRKYHPQIVSDKLDQLPPQQKYLSTVQYAFPK